MTEPTYADIVNAGYDAGMYRRFIAVRYGRVLADGGSPDAMKRARGHARRLAGMTGQSEQAIIDQAIEDHAIIAE